MELLDAAALAKDAALLQNILSRCTDDSTLSKSGNLALDLMNGSYLKIIKEFDGTVINNTSLLEYLSGDDGEIYSHVHDLVLSYIATSVDNSTRVSRTFEMLILGLAYFELYCQSNYTGPELAPALLEVFTESSSGPVSVRELECDGNYAYRTIEIPQTLLIARIILATLANPQEASWREGVVLDETGGIQKKLFQAQNETYAAETLAAERAVLHSIYWWSARAAVVHVRLLQKQSYEDVPTLWREVQSRFQQALQTFSGLPEATDLVEATKPPKEYREEGEAPVEEFSIVGLVPQVQYAVLDEHHHSSGTTSSMTPWASVQKQLATQSWLEWGLCCLHFEFGDKGKKSFRFAKETATLHTEMLASMGKRTKHQHTEYAQLYLYAKSSLLDSASEASTAASTTDAVSTAPAVADKAPAERTGPTILPAVSAGTPATDGTEPVNPDAWQHGEWEMGRRLVREIEGGEEVAVREVLLDSIDGGASENVMLEGGPKFSATATGAVVDKGGDLHPIDQAIILALCLDVGNSNPVDGLTNEEMQPYVERVLELATNWMVYSTGLLERSWLEFERRKTMDRAMLQIQALIDQHTTKLTLLQSTYKCVEDSAPVQDRIKYLYSIVYPAQYELKRDLAMRYLRCQVFVSALNYFRELEMWDEVVTCYQLMDKPHRAEMVVREQLAKCGETPYMLTSLADLTRKEEYYEKAWVLSKQRYPRAKRTLGKICYDRGDFEACVGHMDAALAVHPLVATAWYLRGLACMRLERWDDAIQSFVRCVQQDMEIGEAWANMGAINMRLRAWPKAYEALTEALRHKQDNWRIIENLMTVALALGRWRDVIRYMTRLLDLRHKSERPVHKDELRHLTYIVASQAQREMKTKAKAAATAAAASAATDDADAESVVAPPAAASAGKPPLAPPPPSVPASVLESLRSALEELDPEFDGDDLTSQLEVTPLPDLVISTEKLLTSITNAIRSDPEVWDIFADFQHKLGRYRLALDCRNKQFRGLSSEDAWEKVPEKITAIADAAKALVRAHHFTELRKADIYSCRNLLQTALRRFENNTFPSNDEKATFEALIALMNNLYAGL